MAGGRRTLVPRLLVLLLVVFAVLSRGQEDDDGASTSGEAKKKKKSKHKFCPSTKCADLATEVERWECVNAIMFAPVRAGKDPSKEWYVEHDCGGVGWGNSIRGLYNAASLAAMTGRRLIVSHAPFNRMFDPPLNASSWTYGLEEAGHNKWHMRQHWDFEKHGRAPERYGNFAKEVKADPTIVKQYYEKKILVAGVCGGEREIMVGGDCLEHSMPDFVKCAASRTQGGYMQDNLLPVPFFSTLFKKPGPLLAEYVGKVRTKLGLPALAPGTEPTPGAWGLRTPGYYVFALHFRNIPVGFEPLSIDLNRPRTKHSRNSILEGFWTMAEKYAKRAKKLAECRQQTLLIYFATDDVVKLRPEATKRLSQFGRVVFGLDEDEVGHMSPQWSATDDKLIERARADGTVEHLRSYHEPPAEALEALTDKDGNAIVPTEDFHVANVDKSEEAKLKHANMAMVEWWILAQSNWLMGHSGTSFSDSAAGVGLGPLGAMERMDLVHGNNHASTSTRRDWDTDSCTVVGAADPAFRETCPNRKEDDNADAE